MGRPLSFTPVWFIIYLFIYFRSLIFEAVERCPRDLCQDVGMRCNFIVQIRGGPICIPYILRGENLHILTHSWAIFGLWTRVIWKCKSKKLNKCILLRLFLTMTATAWFHIRQLCSCWEWRAIFLVPELDQDYHASQATPTCGRTAITWYFCGTSCYGYPM